MNQPQPGEISLEEFLAWENAQTERYEWIAGTVVRCAGGSDEHAAIISNMHAIIRAKVAGGPCFVRGSDRKLVPKNSDGRKLGAFYSDLFISCAPEDRKGNAAHFPTVVIEVLSDHVGAEFTSKKNAYLSSREIREYFIIDSTSRYGVRYALTPSGRLMITEYYREPVTIASLGLRLSFDEIYAETEVPVILRPVYFGEDIVVDIE